MAGCAADSLRDMNAMVEINIVGDSIDAHPVQRLMLRETVANRLQDGRIRPDLRMTGHANMRWRKSGKCVALNACMAIPTIETQSANMMFMAERHWLSGHDVLLCSVRRLPVGVGQTDGRDWCKDDGGNDNARNTVRPRAK